MVLGVELRTSCLLGRYSTTLVILGLGSYIFAWADLNHALSSLSYTPCVAGVTNVSHQP
jgi:hypothetical protein